MSARSFLAFLCCASIAPAFGAVLYKSVGADGVVQFSDLPPEKAAAVQRIVMQDSSSPGTTGNPVIASGPTSEEQLRAADAAVQKASLQLDLAEHALAAARRPLWSDNLVQISDTHRTRADQDRIDFYKKNVVIARAALMDLLREKHQADARATMTASNNVSSANWVPLR